MPSKNTKILQFNYYQKSDKIPCTIYVAFKTLIKTVDGCRNSSEKSSRAKVDEHIPCVYPISAIWTFDGIENKHVVLKGFVNSLESTHRR